MTTPSLRRFSATLLLAACGLAWVPVLSAHADSAASAAAATASALAPYDHWYVESTPEGKRGWSRRTVEKDADGNWVTLYRSYSKEAHGPAVQIEEGERRIVETADHKLLSITVASTTSTDKFKQEQKQSWVFTADGIDMAVSSSGREQKRKLPLPQGEWLSPLGVEARKRELMAKGEKHFEIPAFDPGMGTKIYKEIYDRVGEEEVVVGGGEKIKAVKYKMLTSNMPGVDSWEWWDGKGRFVHNEYSMSKMKFITSMATEAVAKEDFKPSDAIGVSVVDCEPAAPARVQRQRKTVWELEYNKEAGVTPPSIGQHKVETLGPGHVRVTIDLDQSDTENQNFKPVDADMGTSTMVDWKDEVIMGMAKEIQTLVGPDASQDQIARASIRFIQRTLRPSLDVGSGTASEVARCKTGDCSEHAILLVALLRAQGIPAREVTGMSYVGAEGFVGHGNCFIYHAWALAWLKNDKGEGRWVNCDAAPGNKQITRIILGTSACDDVTGADESLKTTPMMQNMKAKYVGGDEPQAPASGKQIQ